MSAPARYRRCPECQTGWFGQPGTCCGVRMVDDWIHPEWNDGIEPDPDRYIIVTSAMTGSERIVAVH